MAHHTRPSAKFSWASLDTDALDFCRQDSDAEQQQQRQSSRGGRQQRTASTAASSTTATTTNTNTTTSSAASGDARRSRTDSGSGGGGRPPADAARNGSSGGGERSQRSGGSGGGSEDRDRRPERTEAGRHDGGRDRPREKERRDAEREKPAGKERRDEERTERREADRPARRGSEARDAERGKRDADRRDADRHRRGGERGRVERDRRDRRDDRDKGRDRRDRGRRGGGGRDRRERDRRARRSRSRSRDRDRRDRRSRSRSRDRHSRRKSRSRSRSRSRSSDRKGRGSSEESGERKRVVPGVPVLPPQLLPSLQGLGQQQQPLPPQPQQPLLAKAPSMLNPFPYYNPSIPPPGLMPGPDKDKVRERLEKLKKQGGLQVYQQIMSGLPPPVPPAGTPLPRYLNPTALNAAKFADQERKKKLLWGNKKAELEQQAQKAESSSAGSSTAGVWESAAFEQDKDGKMATKFLRLMGVKNAEEVASKNTEGTEVVEKQKKMFEDMEHQYEQGRVNTHMQKGFGLGYTTQYLQPKS